MLQTILCYLALSYSRAVLNFMRGGEELCRIDARMKKLSVGKIVMYVQVGGCGKGRLHSETND